ncbi:MAG: CPBP family intramembrane metalloprotease [Sphingobacteriales bacterium]|nr:MAG: CPBP family intramembrane metalloprotease [Sphingobacteriales bacterium]
MNNRLFQLQHFAPPVQLLFFFCFFFVANLLQLGLNQLLGLNAASGNSLLVLGMMSSNQLLGFLFPALVFVWLLPQPVTDFFHFRKIEKTSDLLILLILALGTLLLVLGLAEMIQRLPLGQMADELQAQLKNMESSALQMNSVAEVILRIIVMALLPAICEELFFRGVLQRMFYSFFKKPLLSIVATALVFALFHASWYNYLPIMIAGFILGFTYFYTGNIWYNIILHFLVNGTQILVAFFQEDTVAESSFPLTFATGFILSGLVLCFAAIRQLRKGKQISGLNWSLPYRQPGQN